MGFDLDKKNILAKQDKSKKQSIDHDIVGLIESINLKEDYFTTSSCSGRVSLWKEGERKDKGEWLFVTHNKVTSEDQEVIKGILANPPLETTWLRAEPFIIHISTRNLDAAQDLLKKAKQLFKRSVILTISNNPIVEIRGSAFLDMPISSSKELKIPLDRIEFFIHEANKKLEKTKQKTKEFTSSLLDF